ETLEPTQTRVGRRSSPRQHTRNIRQDTRRLVQQPGQCLRTILGRKQISEWFLTRWSAWSDPSRAFPRRWMKSGMRAFSLVFTSDRPATMGERPAKELETTSLEPRSSRSTETIAGRPSI